jgi:ribose-phosphate pyrophosphokinase
MGTGDCVLGGIALFTPPFCFDIRRHPLAITLSLPELAKPQTQEGFNKVKIFSGRANQELATEIAAYLGTTLSPITIKNFSDGETYVKVEESVRGFDVFVVQPTCNPVNDHMVELLVMIDALKRASANTITAIMPYYGYARQDRKTVGREAISAKLMADLIATAGATRVVAMDLHTGQLQGFFNILTDHLYATPVLFKYIKDMQLDNLVVVSPDAGGVERARVFAKKLNCPIAIVDKRRAAHNVAEVYNVIGDVKDKNAILVDDMIDTAGTICAAAKLLSQEGARHVYAMATHPVFSGPAIERLANSVFDEVIVTNSIPLTAAGKQVDKITQLSIAPMLGEAIRRIHDDLSVSEMFD